MARGDQPDRSVDAFNRGVIDEFRANAGRVGGRFEGSTLALLTTVGARSGIRRTTPLAYFELNGMLAVVASAMGDPKHPSWLTNLQAHPRVMVEAGREIFDALASIPRGIERDRLFAQVVEQDPDFADYQKRIERVIPVVMLQRLGGAVAEPASGDHARLVAWASELRQVHERLREALRVAKGAAAAGRSLESAKRELLLFCHGFCIALTGHHQGEDRDLFPAIATAHPELRDTLRYLQQDHSMIAHLVTGLQASLTKASSPTDLARHLGGHRRDHGEPLPVRGAQAAQRVGDSRARRRPATRPRASLTVRPSPVTPANATADQSVHPSKTARRASPQLERPQRRGTKHECPGDRSRRGIRRACPTAW